MSLEELRTKIDTVDDELLALFKKRMEFVKQVGKLKTESGTKGSLIRPAREATMMRKLVAAGSEVFSRGIIYNIWRAIIAGSTQQEAPFTLSIFSPDENKTAYWLAREYFGADTPCKFHLNPLPALHEVASNPSIVGIFPLSLHRGRPWWADLATMHNPPNIFAILPFAGKPPFEIETIVALAHTPQEETGQDITLVVVEDAKSISRESIQQHFAKNGIPSRDILKYEEGTGVNVRRYQLFLCEGFYTPKSSEIATVSQSLNALNTADSPLKISVIGQYGVPL
jgi:chorismate mutase